jgi:hypothetical protein
MVDKKAEIWPLEMAMDNGLHRKKRQTDRQTDCKALYISIAHQIDLKQKIWSKGETENARQFSWELHTLTLKRKAQRRPGEHKTAFPKEKTPGSTLEQL